MVTGYKTTCIEKYIVLKSWWTVFLAVPISKCVAVVLLNHTKVTPNMVTCVAICFRAITIISFLQTTRLGLNIGAISFYIAHMLDGVDGVIARATGQTSETGRYLDHVSDLIGDILILCALAFSQNLLFTPLIIGMIFMHITESYISYIAGFAIKEDKGRSEFFIFKKFNNYRNWWFEKNCKSFITFPDYTAFIFILMPILGMAKEGLHIGFYFLFTIVCYTILSTFVSIHTGKKLFP